MELHLIANDIRSAENIGSLFRTADSLGVAKVWITGISPTPEHAKVAKTALGAQVHTAWEQQLDVVSVINGLRVAGFRIVGLEIDDRALNLSSYQPHQKTALLLGNEVAGIPPSLIALCDDVVFMTQKGFKESMNVGVAAGIASYWILNR
jgi:tRNA G18 (ribose-2'-O)-methylase SpoU